MRRDFSKRRNAGRAARLGSHRDAYQAPLALPLWGGGSKLRSVPKAELPAITAPEASASARKAFPPPRWRTCQRNARRQHVRHKTRQRNRAALTLRSRIK
jgi:hypothetical protein